MKWVKNLSNRTELTVVEDAAHVDLTDNITLKGIGLHSDWVIGSLRKFFPVYDGGCVFPVEPSQGDVISVNSRPTVRDEIRGASFLYHNITAQIGTRVGVLDIDDNNAADQHISRHSSEAQRQSVGYSDPRFSPHAALGMSRISKLLIRVSADPASREVRRAGPGSP